MIHNKRLELMHLTKCLNDVQVNLAIARQNEDLILEQQLQEEAEVLVMELDDTLDEINNNKEHSILWQ